MCWASHENAPVMQVDLIDDQGPLLAQVSDVDMLVLTHRIWGASLTLFDICCGVRWSKRIDY